MPVVIVFPVFGHLIITAPTVALLGRYLFPSFGEMPPAMEAFGLARRWIYVEPWCGCDLPLAIGFVAALAIL